MSGVNNGFSAQSLASALKESFQERLLMNNILMKIVRNKHPNAKQWFIKETTKHQGLLAGLKKFLKIPEKEKFICLFCDQNINFNYQLEEHKITHIAEIKKKYGCFL